MGKLLYCQASGQYILFITGYTRRCEIYLPRIYFDDFSVIKDRWPIISRTKQMMLIPTGITNRSIALIRNTLLHERDLMLLYWFGSSWLFLRVRIERNVTPCGRMLAPSITMGTNMNRSETISIDSANWKA